MFTFMNGPYRVNLLANLPPPPPPPAVVEKKCMLSEFGRPIFFSGVGVIVVTAVA